MDEVRPPAELDVASIRSDFPILSEHVNGKPLIFIDNGASAQKPNAVINAVRHCYEECYANVHRGTYDFSARTTHAYEQARESVRRFLNAKSEKEVIFTSGTTAAINLVAHSFAREMLAPGDEIIISEMEHHSNIVPWQMAAEAKGLVLSVVPVLDDGSLDIQALEGMISEKTKLLAITHVSNVLGTVTPVERIVNLAHAHGAKVLFDGSQAVMHMGVDVQALGCDFYVFTGHKIYGPSGIGVLYGKEALLDAMPPFLGGGDMIASVTFEKSTWAELPAKFEAGTPPIIQAIGLGAAIDYVEAVGLSSINAHEMALLEHATAGLGTIDGVRIIGTAQSKGPVVSFVMENGHPHDVSSMLDQDGIAVRAGHHCAEPLMARFGVVGTTRASFAMYNTMEEIDQFIRSLAKIRRILG